MAKDYSVTFFNSKILRAAQVAKDFLHSPFHFPHNLDFRGRAYPITPHLQVRADCFQPTLMRLSSDPQLTLIRPSSDSQLALN